MDISVIIPIYNVEGFLVDCLESVRRNVDGLNAEVLLIDAGSKDNTSIIAQLYAEKLDKFSYYRIDNFGLIRARNYGVSLATGTCLIFIDPGVVLVDGMLRTMLEMTEKNEMDFMVCNFTRYKDKKARDSSLKELEIMQKENKTLQEIIKSLEGSVSFKTGRVLTWLPRKLRGGVNCMKQHGLGYTLKRTVEHFGIDMGTGSFEKKQNK